MTEIREYEEMKGLILALLASGKVSSTPTLEQRIDFAYGNTKMENSEITRDMVRRAAKVCF